MQYIIDNIYGIQWYDIVENEKSLTQYTYLESELIYISQNGGTLEGQVWMADNRDIYSKDGGYLIYVELTTGKVMKLFYNKTLNEYTSQIVVDISLLGYGSPCGAIITYDLKSNKLTLFMNW